ncbi:hypothetical protein QTP88_019282 [Uroleucon formosanum]
MCSSPSSSFHRRSRLLLAWSPPMRKPPYNRNNGTRGRVTVGPPRRSRRRCPLRAAAATGKNNGCCAVRRRRRDFFARMIGGGRSGGALGGDRARVPRTDGWLTRPVCKKTVFFWWGKPVAAVDALKIRESPQSANYYYYRRHHHHSTIPHSDIRESRTEPVLRGTTLTTVFEYDKKPIGSSAYRHEFRTLASVPLSHPQPRSELRLVIFRFSFDPKTVCTRTVLNVRQRRRENLAPAAMSARRLVTGTTDATSTYNNNKYYYNNRFGGTRPLAPSKPPACGIPSSSAAAEPGRRTIRCHCIS